MPLSDSGAHDPAATLDRLRARVRAAPTLPADASPSECRAEFAHWWLIAARLAALGDEEPFRAWPRVAGELGVDAIESVADAARHGVRILGDGGGDPLAEAIIDAEDAGCLLEVEARTTGLLPGLATIVDAWLEAAADAVPDEDAAEILREHAAAFPLPSASRLPAVGTPLTAVELMAAAASMPLGRPTRLAPVFEFEETLALFDGGRPTENMLRRFAERRGEGVTPSEAMMRMTPQLDEFWGVVVRIAGDASTLVRSVRLGTRPMRRVDPAEADGSTAEDGVLYETGLAGLPLAERLRLLRSDIGITTVDGGRFLA